MRVALTGGAYQARGVITSAQACINMYAEMLPQVQGEPAQWAYYPTPGTVFLHALSGGGPVRGLYPASSGVLYAVGGSTLYRLDNAVVGGALGLVETVLCQIGTATGVVSMSDNTLSLVLVDGSSAGYAVDLVTNAVTILGTATDNFYGANRVDYLDTFLIFNKPATPQFYVSGSLAITFDPLDFANKSGASDLLVACVAARGELWLPGRDTSEIWTDSGSPDFPFQKLAGILVEHGCAAVASIAKADGQIYFLSHDLQGRGIVLKASGYDAKRISTHAIEHTINEYPTIADAVGYCFQLEGHTFYVVSFPAGDSTWVYDEATGQWLEWTWTDPAGETHRHRGQCFAAAYERSIIGDWQNGNLYTLSLDVLTDSGAVIPRTRSYPHLIADGKRVVYRQFSADIECGYAGSDAAQMLLSWSDDRGYSFGAPIAQPFGPANSQPKWSRLGLARDRVFQLTWTAPVRTALQGAWIDVSESVS